MRKINWKTVNEHLKNLYRASEGLEKIFQRRFSLDGHLVGSIGEVVAAYMFNLKLERPSTKGYDAKTKDGKRVEIKLTQRNAVAFNSRPKGHLIVLHRPKGGPIELIFEGPGKRAWKKPGKKQRNGQQRISISSLKKHNSEVLEVERLEKPKKPPI